MKKSVIYFFLSTCIFFLAISCSSGKKYTGGKLMAGPAAADIVNYINQGIISNIELEQKSINAYNSVTRENFTTNQKLIEKLRDFVIPTYKRFVMNLRNIPIENQEVRQLHTIYVNAAESTLEGFQTLLIATENNDETLTKQGNKKLEEGRIGIEKWKAEKDKLYKKHGVASVEEK